MLEDCYVTLNVFIDQDTASDFENPPTGDLTLKGTIMGFIQARGGSRPFANQALMPLSTHILYTDITTDFLVGEYVEFMSEFYLVEYIPPLNGVSGMGDHLESGIIFHSDVV